MSYSYAGFGDLEDDLLVDVRKKQHAAELAGAVASDRGATAFSKHLDYPAAISANQAAVAAYQAAWNSAAAVLKIPPLSITIKGAQDLARSYQETFQDRIEELNLARAALTKDMAAHLNLQLKPGQKPTIGTGIMAALAKPAAPTPKFTLSMSSGGSVPTPVGASKPIWPWLLVGGIVVAGGGYIIWRQTKKAA